MTTEQAAQQPAAQTAPAATSTSAPDAADRIMQMAQMPDRFALEPTCFDEAWRIAQAVAKSALCGITEPSVALVIIQSGRELGLSAMQSLRAIYVINGRPSLYADAMVAIVRASGKCARWRIVESTDKTCTIETVRAGEDWPTSITWTIEQASKITFEKDGKVKALTEKDVWLYYPAAMLRHRAASELIRMVYSDVCLGMYTPEEIEHEARVERIFGGAELPPAARTQTVNVAAKPLSIGAKTAATAGIPTSNAAPAAPSAPAANAPTGVDVWIPKFATVKDADALGKLSGEVPKELTQDPRLKEAYRAAKERLGIPVKASTGPTPPAAAAAASAPVSPDDQILYGWVEEIGKLRSENEVTSFHAQFINKVPLHLRVSVTGATTRKLQGLSVADPASAIQAAIAAQAQAGQ